ncbi:hypothetical protein PCANC_11509 [Puccinia coronata f. sp. avenae]|uniref:Uncharacterized protein n=1 Tax=Puccinia coronata f. sp. avenae TaxID=200324 RepID=A0A2N5TSH3_9BASI|nr:hypothetical protein PCASD_25287 [Puccinia coronata f. sp. avenae]PLW09605.1 hypothetical protein PCANC_22837 [Puccinia coronata f. sp. avenae]PLW28431.1 hypothetical protein PCASD_19131 [Puccinia coronata f. sp. avenae]PLW41787.1 hypothetical protein PCANC_11509 [Puccinia coronata f. sp. avenae]
MSVQTQSRPHPAGAPNGTTNGDVGLPTFVHRVVNIPVIADTWGAVYSTLQANPYSAAFYGKAEGAVLYIYEQSKPLQVKLAGPIEQVDAVANKGLDFVQSKAPMIFEVRTEDLISRAREPANQVLAYGKTYQEAATARLGPMVEQFHSQLTRSQQTLAHLQEKLQAGLQNVRKDPKAVPDQIKHLSEQVIGELERLSGFILEKRKDLPQNAQQVINPVVDKLRKGYVDIKEEMTKADVPLVQRATNVLHYSKDHASPVVHEAVQAFKKIIGSSS